MIEREEPAATEIAYSDEGVVFAVRDGVVVGIWWEPSHERHAIAFRIVRERHRVLGHPVAILSISPEGAAFPDVSEFPALALEAAAATPSILAMAIVFDGHGPWVEGALEHMSTLDATRVAVRPDSFPRRFATSIEEGATWLAIQCRRIGDETTDRAAILEVVGHALARASR